MWLAAALTSGLPSISAEALGGGTTFVPVSG
jgi:hypothetical protein